MDIDKEGQIIFEKQQKSRRTVIFGDISIFGKTFFEYFAKNEKLLSEQKGNFTLCFVKYTNIDFTHENNLLTT